MNSGEAASDIVKAQRQGYIDTIRIPCTPSNGFDIKGYSLGRITSGDGIKRSADIKPTPGTEIYKSYKNLIELSDFACSTNCLSSVSTALLSHLICAFSDWSIVISVIVSKRFVSSIRITIS